MPDPWIFVNNIPNNICTKQYFKAIIVHYCPFSLPSSSLLSSAWIKNRYHDIFPALLRRSLRYSGHFRSTPTSLDFLLQESHEITHTLSFNRTADCMYHCNRGTKGDQSEPASARRQFWKLYKFSDFWVHWA